MFVVDNLYLFFSEHILQNSIAPFLDKNFHTVFQKNEFDKFLNFIKSFEDYKNQIQNLKIIENKFFVLSSLVKTKIYLYTKTYICENKDNVYYITALPDSLLSADNKEKIFQTTFDIETKILSNYKNIIHIENDYVICFKLELTHNSKKFINFLKDYYSFYKETLKIDMERKKLVKVIKFNIHLSESVYKKTN